jgi:predicted nucleic acid-binding protein
VKILVDTNVWLRRIQIDSPQRPIAIDALNRLASSGREICIVPQVVYEMWVTGSRPRAVNGLELPAELLRREIDIVLQATQLFPDAPDLCARWLDLVTRHDCKGKPAHDARIVAAMLSHGIVELLTFNPEDFQRFEGLTILGPADVIGRTT